jgi:hypothetical protein
MGSCRISAFIGVSIQPGEIALTRTPVAASSTARARVSCPTAAFDMPYALTEGCPISPAGEMKKTIEPRP